MPSTRAHSPSPMSDAEDEQVSDMTEIEESVTAEAGPSSEPEVKAGSSGKGKGKGGGQQNRARVTVVCAECKRLKLKCDRQQPCGNCKAKEKTDKCLYSQEAASKVDVQSLHNRVMAVEIVLSLVAAGVPVIEYESSHPAVAAEVKKRLDDFLARGGKLIPGPNALKYLNQAQNSSDVQDGDDGPAKGSLLSDLHDIPHPYTHIILESEGESFDGFCTCDHDQHDLPTSTIEDSGKVKEEDVRANVDVNMIPETVSQSQPRSPTKAGPTSSSVSLLPDALSDLPPLKVYYPNPQVTEEATPSFYPAVSDSKKAYTGSSPPVTPSTTERSLPLGKSSGAPRSGPTSKPSVTPALIQCLPASTRCNEMLGTAQAILEDIPIELGLRSRTAALPQELIDKFPGEMAKATGWVALSKRVKRCLNRRKDQALRPPPRHKVTPAASSPIAIPANPQGPKDRKRAQAAAAVYGRAGDVNFKDKDNAPPPPPIKLDPRIISHQEKERSKPKPPGSTTQSHSGPPLIIDESLPFFAVVCSLLAFGADPAKDRDTSCKESAPYLLALAQQALGLWVDGGEHLATDRTDEAVKEARADYFRACSLAIQFYLMRTSPSVSRSRRDKNSLGPYRHPNERQLVNLMSKMAAQLAAWDYEEGLVPVRDAEEGPSSPGGPAELKLIPKIAVAEGQEARIRLLWQIMFHDACIAGMFQREPFIPRSRYTTTVLPTLVPDYCEMVADVLKSCDDQDENRSAAGGGSPQPASVDKPALKERREVEEERLRTERFYLGLRARITQLSNVVDRRLAKGYSLEQAAVLAGDVQALFEGLPDELRWGIQKAVEGTSSELLANGESLDSIIVSQTPPTSSNVAKGKGKGRAVDGSPKPKSARVSLDLDEGEVQSTQSSQEAAASKLRTRTLSCELALMARLLVVRIYSPFAPKLASAPLDSTSSLTIPDGLLDASKAVIRLAKLIHRPGQAHAAPSTILAIYPFDRLVLDATLMCAQHCFGGTVIKKKKDDKVGVQKKDAGSAELMQTIGIGLDLLDAVYSASQQAPSSSSSTHNLDVSNTLEAKIVASLRKQWLLKNSSFTPAQSRKRTRSTMEGKSAGASAEPAKKTSSPPQAEPEPGSAMEEPRSVPSAAPDDSPSKDSTPSPPNQPSNSTQPSAPSRKTPAVPLNPETRVLGREVVERKRGKAAHASSASQVGVRLRGPGATTNATKRKQDTKAQALSQQPLMTTAARTVKEDGKLGYVDEDQAPNAPGPQRPPTAPPPPLVHQITPPQPPAQLSPPSHPYNGYDSPPAVQAPYSTHPSNPSPASQYQPTFEGGMVADTSVPPTPYQEYGYSGYPPQPIQHPSYHQQHQPTYTSHPNAPMPSSVPTGMAPDGYFNHQHGGNSGYANHSGYAPPAGPDVYMKQPVAPSYSTLAYPGEMPNAPGSSMSAWQDQQNTPVQMQQPLPQHDFSWQPPIADGWQ